MRQKSLKKSLKKVSAEQLAKKKLIIEYLINQLPTFCEGAINRALKENPEVIFDDQVKQNLINIANEKMKDLLLQIADDKLKVDVKTITDALLPVVDDYLNTYAENLFKEGDTLKVQSNEIKIMQEQAKLSNQGAIQMSKMETSVSKDQNPFQGSVFQDGGWIGDNNFNNNQFEVDNNPRGNLLIPAGPVFGLLVPIQKIALAIVAVESIFALTVYLKNTSLGLYNAVIESYNIQKDMCHSFYNSVFGAVEEERNHINDGFNDISNNATVFRDYDL